MNDTKYSGRLTIEQYVDKLKAENKKLKQDINIMNLHQYAPEKIADLYRQLDYENKKLREALEIYADSEHEYHVERYDVKTKEIECFLAVSNGDLSDPYRSIGVNWSMEEIERLGLDEDEIVMKAKLIIELPEKKIEISESQFDKAYFETCGVHPSESQVTQSFKKELGFK